MSTSCTNKLVPGAAVAPFPGFISAPPPPVQKQDAQHKVLQHKGAHTKCSVAKTDIIDMFEVDDGHWRDIVPTFKSWNLLGNTVPALCKGCLMVWPWQCLSGVKSLPVRAGP